MASVTIPPWLQIDPIAPARIRLQANAQRNAAAASERAAQAQAADLQFRREQAAAQQAAQQRSEERRERVFQQTQDRELAEAAQQMQLRREAQAQKSQQFQQNLRMRQQAAEREAQTAAQQMQGMQAVQKGLQAGEPLQKLISQNAGLLFAKHPERIPSAVPKTISTPGAFIAKEITDEAGNPLGIRAIPGAHGSIKPLPRTTMSPEGMLRADQLRLGVINRQLEEADPSSPEFARLTKARDGIMTRLEQVTSRRGAAPAAGTSGVLPGAPAAASAPSGKIRVKSPEGKTGMIPADQLEAALEAGYEEIGAEPSAPAFEEEADTPAEEE